MSRIARRNRFFGIGTRLSVLIGALGSIILGLAILGAAIASVVQENSEVLMQTHMKALRAANTAANAFGVKVVDHANQAAFHHLASKDMARRNIAKALQEGTEAWSHLVQNAVDQRVVGLIKVQEVRLDDVIILTRQIIDLLDHDDVEGLQIVLRSRMAPATELLVTGLSAIQAAQMGFMQEQADKVSHRAEELTFLAILLGGLGVAIAVLAGIWAIQRLTMPVGELTSCLLSMAEGDLDVEVPHRGRNDEIGSIASAFVMFQDVSRDARRATHELQAMEARLRSITDDIPGVIFQFRTAATRGGQFLFMSEGCDRVLGIKREVLLSDATAFLGLLFPEDAARLFDAVEMSEREMQPLGVDLRIYNPEAGERWITVHAVPHRTADAACVWNGFLFDTTATKLLHAELQTAKLKSEEASRLKGAFLATMSHEIRTPLNAIIGLATLISRTPLSDRQADYVEKVRSAANSLLTIINDILDYSKIEAGKMTVEAVEMSIDAVLRRVGSIAALKAEEKGLELLFALAPRVPDRILGDPTRLTQILTNLVGNAIKFTERGEVLVSVGVEDAGRDAAALSITVRDTGIGMTPEQCARLFKPFVQGDDTTTRRYGGTGLGLSISRHLAEVMGGRLSVSSTAGEGTAFTLRVPLATPPGVDGERTPGSRPSPLVGRRHRVLVVDDNPAACRVLGEMLSGMGADVATTEDPADAIGRVVGAEAQGQPFSVVYMDWNMPGMDGVTAAQRILDQMSGAPPAIILVSAHSRAQLEEEAARVGVTRILPKPVSPSALFDSLAETLADTMTGVDRADHAGSMRAGQPMPAMVAGQRLNGCLVLLAEDNPVNQQIARELLEAEGAEVEVVGDGRAAITRVSNLDLPVPDVVLMDLQMPGMDGLQAAREIRRSGRFSALPLIAMTAHTMQEEIDACYAAGMNAHLAKPVDEEKMIAVIIAAMDADLPEPGYLCMQAARRE